MRHNKIAQIRESRGMTQKELADAVGVTQQTIYYYEHGDHDPRASMLKRLAKALGCTVSELLDIKSTVEYSAVKLEDKREAELTRIYRELSDGNRSVLMSVARALKCSQQRGSKSGTQL